MFFGIALITAGILIAVYPQLLAHIVAAVLIFFGIFFVFLGYSYKRMTQRSEDPVKNFFIRF